MPLICLGRFVEGEPSSCLGRLYLLFRQAGINTTGIIGEIPLISKENSSQPAKLIATRRVLFSGWEQLKSMEQVEEGSCDSRRMGVLKRIRDIHFHRIFCLPSFCRPTFCRERQGRAGGSVTPRHPCQLTSQLLRQLKFESVEHPLSRFLMQSA
jgi:hypothetical protein